MKIVFLILAFISQAYASTVVVDGIGRASAYCRGDAMARICFNQVQEQAERDSARDADARCRLQQGTLQYYSGSCFTSCNPAFPPTNNANTFVSCSARCRFNCDVP